MDTQSDSVHGAAHPRSKPKGPAPEGDRAFRGRTQST